LNKDTACISNTGLPFSISCLVIFVIHLPFLKNSGKNEQVDYYCGLGCYCNRFLVLIVLLSC